MSYWQSAYNAVAGAAQPAYDAVSNAAEGVVSASSDAIKAAHSGVSYVGDCASTVVSTATSSVRYGYKGDAAQFLHEKYIANVDAFSSIPEELRKNVYFMIDLAKLNPKQVLGTLLHDCTYRTIGSMLGRLAHYDKELVKYVSPRLLGKARRFTVTSFWIDDGNTRSQTNQLLFDVILDHFGDPDLHPEYHQRPVIFFKIIHSGNGNRFTKKFKEKYLEHYKDVEHARCIAALDEKLPEPGWRWGFCEDYRTLFGEMLKILPENEWDSDYFEKVAGYSQGLANGFPLQTRHFEALGKDYFIDLLWDIPDVSLNDEEYIRLFLNKYSCIDKWVIEKHTENPFVCKVCTEIHGFHYAVHFTKDAISKSIELQCEECKEDPLLLKKKPFINRSHPIPQPYCDDPTFQSALIEEFPHLFINTTRFDGLSKGDILAIVAETPEWIVVVPEPIRSEIVMDDTSLIAHFYKIYSKFKGSFGEPFHLSKECILLPQIQVALFNIVEPYHFSVGCYPFNVCEADPKFYPRMAVKFGLGYVEQYERAYNSRDFWIQYSELALEPKQIELIALLNKKVAATDEFVRACYWIATKMTNSDCMFILKEPLPSLAISRVIIFKRFNGLEKEEIQELNDLLKSACRGRGLKRVVNNINHPFHNQLLDCIHTLSSDNLSQILTCIQRAPDRQSMLPQFIESVAILSSRIGENRVMKYLEGAFEKPLKELVTILNREVDAIFHNSFTRSIPNLKRITLDRGATSALTTFAKRQNSRTMRDGITTFAEWAADGTFLTKRMDPDGNRHLTKLKTMDTKKFEKWKDLHGKSYDIGGTVVKVSDFWKDFLCMGVGMGSSCQNVMRYPDTHARSVLGTALDGREHIVAIYDSKGAMTHRLVLRQAFASTGFFYGEEAVLYVNRVYTRGYQKNRQAIYKACEMIAKDLNMPLYAGKRIATSDLPKGVKLVAKPTSLSFEKARSPISSYDDENYKHHHGSHSISVPTQWVTA